jgi:hypothetical protein
MPIALNSRRPSSLGLNHNLEQGKERTSNISYRIVLQQDIDYGLSERSHFMLAGASTHRAVEYFDRNLSSQLALQD